MKTIDHFNLDTAHGRYKARKCGFDVPKRSNSKNPRKPMDFYIDRSGDCWMWNDRVNQWGYGIMLVNKKTAFPHRIVWERANNASAKGLVIMHKCDNPRCCNPNHLSAGSHRDNQLDKVNKNRQAKGEKNGSSVLLEGQVLEMRRLYATGKFRYIDLATQYGISRDTAQKAIRGIYWKHI